MVKVRRKVLEVGFGGKPVGVHDWYPISKMTDECAMLGKGAFALFAKEVLPPDTYYVGVDIPPSHVKEDPLFYNKGKYFQGLRQTLRGLDGEYKQVEDKTRVGFAYMDGTRLAFKDGSFDEVHFHWVLTSPGVWPPVARMLVDEAHRVLVPDGTLTATGEMFRLDQVVQGADLSGFGNYAATHETTVMFSFAPYMHKVMEDAHFDVATQMHTIDETTSYMSLLAALAPHTCLAQAVSGLVMARKDVDATAFYADAFVVVGKKCSSGS